MLESGVFISKTSLEIQEGSSGEYQMRLRSKPSGNVIITPSSDSEFIEIETKEPYFRGVSEPIIRWREQGSLTFTQDNWNTLQTIRVTINASVPGSGEYTITHSTDHPDIIAPDVKIEVYTASDQTERLKNLLKEIDQALACEVIEAIELRTLSVENRINQKTSYCHSINPARFETQIDNLTDKHREILEDRRVLEVRDVYTDFDISGLNEIVSFMPKLRRIHIMGNHLLKKINLDLPNPLETLFINENDAVETITINSIKTTNLVISRFYVREDYENAYTAPGDPVNNILRYCSPSSTDYRRAFEANNQLPAFLRKHWKTCV